MVKITHPILFTVFFTVWAALFVSGLILALSSGGQNPIALWLFFISFPTTVGYIAATRIADRRTVEGR